MCNLIFSGFVIILLLCILFMGVKADAKSEKTIILQRFNNLRGFFAIEIIIGHVVRYEKTILYALGKFMIISVAFFFFVSAWGLSYSFRVKDNYLKGFLRTKCCYLLGLIIVAYGFNVVVSLLVPVQTGYYMGINSIVPFFLQGTNWYLWVLLFFYILFYLVFRYFQRNRWLYFFVIVAVLTALLFRAGWPQGWYASAFAFPFGLFYEEYYEKCNKLLYSKKGGALTLLLILLGISSQLLGQDSLIGMVYLRNIMCIAGLIILIYVLHIFDFNNRGLQVLTEYSTELYLFQFIYLRISEASQWDYKFRMLFVITLTAVTAFFMHMVINRARVYLKR